MEKQLNISSNTTNAGVSPKSNLGRYKIALLLLLLITCISFAGCTDTLAATSPTGEYIATEIPGNVIEPQILDETDMITEPVTEETVPFETESTPTETIHTHSYTSKVTNPSCTEGGYTTFICGCGDTYTADQTDAVGHNYSSTVKAATRTEKGYTTYTCNTCGDSYTADQTDAIGHTYHEKVTLPPVLKRVIRPIPALSVAIPTPETILLQPGIAGVAGRSPRSRPLPPKALNSAPVKPAARPTLVLSTSCLKKPSLPMKPLAVRLVATMRTTRRTPIGRVTPNKQHILKFIPFRRTMTF